MGLAAFNISGQTICSAFHKKMYQGTNHLSADELNTFRIKYRHLKIIIIDEISMIVNMTLSFTRIVFYKKNRCLPLLGIKKIETSLNKITNNNNAHFLSKQSSSYPLKISC